MTSGTGERGMTLIELSMIGLLLGIVALIAWPQVRRNAAQAGLDGEARRLVRALRDSRDAAAREGKTVTLDTATICRRLIPNPPVIRFFPDGTTDNFSARPDHPSDLAVVMNETGRILIFHEAV